MTVQSTRIILYVSDMSTSVKFYRDLLDFDLSWPIVEDYSDEAWVTFQLGEFSLALHSGGARQLGKDVPELQFNVADLKSVREELGSKGLECGEIINPHPGVEFFSASDPDGMRLSFKQV